MRKILSKSPLTQLAEPMRCKIHNLHPQSGALPDFTKFTGTFNEDNPGSLECGLGRINETEISTKASPGLSQTSALKFLSEMDFNRCRGHLKNVIYRCTQLEFGILSIMISGVFTGFRRLDKYELFSLLTLSWNPDTLADNNFAAIAEGFFDFSQSDCSLGKSERRRTSLFLVDGNGLLDFLDQDMRQFLGSYTIHGLSLTHEMMANACIRQLEVNNNTSHPLFRTQSSNHLSHDSAFSEYANQFWSSHYRLVTPPCSLLSERVHHLIYTSSYLSVKCVDGCNWLAPCSDIADAAIEYCEVKSLQTLVAPYIQFSTRARLAQLRTDPPDPRIDSPDIRLSMAFSQLELTATQQYTGTQRARSLSPDSSHSSVDELWTEEQRWVRV